MGESSQRRSRPSSFKRGTPVPNCSPENRNAFAIAEGIDYAASFTQGGARPVKVINMSFGDPFFSSQAEQDAINRAFTSGIVLVASAGNNNRNRVSYPAASPNVIAVSAVDRRKERASYSNFGPEVSLAAPGGACSRDDDNDGMDDDADPDELVAAREQLLLLLHHLRVEVVGVLVAELPDQDRHRLVAKRLEHIAGS